MNNGKIFLAGVSGGPDSMSMLDLYKDKVKAVCFVNYYDRDDTHIDARIVKDYCEKNNIILHTLDVTKEVYEMYPYNNYQDQCRRIRYNFYNSTAKMYNLKYVIIAHNYNDFLETAYSQIVHNKKNLFLGIKKISNYKNITILRPLINFLKPTLRKYCDENNIEYIIDKTNAMDIYQRNIYRKILNSIDKKNLFNLINYINKYNEVNKPYEEEIQSLYIDWKINEFDIGFILYNAYFYQYNLIYTFLSNNFFSKINSQKIDQIIKFIMTKGNSHKLYRLANNIFLSKKNNKLSIIKE